MQDLRIIAGAAVVLAALGLFAASRWFGRPGRAAGLVAVVVALEIAIWVPPHVRDWALAVTAMLLVFAGMDGTPGATVLVGLFMGALVLAMGELPGGTSAVILGIVAIAGLGRIRAASRHLARVRRAADLTPGERPRDDVQIGGKVAGRGSKVPLHPEIEAAWWALCVNDRARATSGPLRIDSEAGTVLAELERGRIDMKHEHSRFLKCQDRAALEAVVGPIRDREPPAGVPAEVCGDPGQPEIHYTVYWLEPGADAYVVGTPMWERAPADLGGYRDAPVIPVFRGQDAYLTDLSAGQALADARWTVAAWSVWGPVCGAVASLQLAGLL